MEEAAGALSEYHQTIQTTDILSSSLKGLISVVALVRIFMKTWRETPLPPLEPPAERTQEVTGVVGAATAKLVTARRKAGIKERTRIVSEM